MLVKYGVFLVLLFPVAGFPQSSIRNEGDLLSALMMLKGNDQPGAAALLEEHRSLVANSLWGRLVEAAAASSHGGDSPKAFFILEVASNVATQLQDQQLVAHTYFYTGKLHSDLGDHTAAINAYLKSKEAFEGIGAGEELAYVLSELSTLYLFAADYQKAREYSEQVLALVKIVEGAGSTSNRLLRRGTAAALSNLGNICKQEGDYDQALDHLHQSLDLFRKLDEESSSPGSDVSQSRQLDHDAASFKVEIAYALTDIGRVYRVRGDHFRALHYFNQALTLAKSRNMKFALAGVLNSTGLLYLEQGDYPKAADFFNRSLEASRLSRSKIDG